MAKIEQWNLIKICIKILRFQHLLHLKQLNWTYGEFFLKHSEFLEHLKPCKQRKRHLQFLSISSSWSLTMLAMLDNLSVILLLADLHENLSMLSANLRRSILIYCLNEVLIFFDLFTCSISILEAFLRFLWK